MLLFDILMHKIIFLSVEYKFTNTCGTHISYGYKLKEKNGDNNCLLTYI